jgi:hypothetical protein
MSMTERELLGLWNKARLQMILAQLAPTFLLIVTVGLLGAGLGTAPLAVRLAALLILLASGILGALAEYSTATDAKAIAADLGALPAPSALTAAVLRQAPWLAVIRFVTPAIFVVIFMLLAAVLIAGG